MLTDSFRISSKFHPDKTCSNTNAETFFNEFHKFYYNVRMKKNPNLPKKICDPYGFMLLCEDFDKDVSFDKGIKCRAVYEGKGSKDNVTYKYYQGMFSFPQLLNLLYRGYWFDYNLAIKIYNAQHNPLHILTQIMKGRGYIMNRFKPNNKHVGQLMNYATESKISLNENQFIPTPYINRVCDGMSWPCIVHKYDRIQYLQICETHNYGEGLCLINGADEIIDVLKINDLWLTETPLINRIKFADQFDEYEPIQYVKAWSLRSAFDGAQMLNANSQNGVLIRPCYQDFFDTNWFEWNENSLIYCCNINNKLTTFNTKTSRPDFFTLKGDLGEVNEREERVTERMWLDDFDIKEFQQILDLNGDNSFND